MTRPGFGWTTSTWSSSGKAFWLDVTAAVRHCGLDGSKAILTRPVLSGEPFLPGWRALPRQCCGRTGLFECARRDAPCQARCAQPVPPWSIIPSASCRQCDATKSYGKLTIRGIPACTFDSDISLSCLTSMRETYCYRMGASAIENETTLPGAFQSDGALSR